MGVCQDCVSEHAWVRAQNQAKGGQMSEDCALTPALQLTAQNLLTTSGPISLDSIFSLLTSLSCSQV
jgi:hypothetical protein